MRISTVLAYYNILIFLYCTNGNRTCWICDGQGVPLAVRLTGANRNDSQEALRWSMRFLHFQANGGDRDAGRTVCSATVATTRGRSGTACARVTFSRCWSYAARLNQFRRLRVRYDKRAEIYEALLSLGCTWISWQVLRRGWSTG